MARAKKQMEIKGTERKSIPEVDAAGEAYREARNDRMARTVVESDAKEALIEVMKRNKLKVYRDTNAVPPFTVTLKEGKFSVKVEDVVAGESTEDGQADDDKEDAA